MHLSGRTKRGRVLKEVFQFALILVFLGALLGASPLESIDARGQDPAPIADPVLEAPLFAPLASVNLSVPSNIMVGENFNFTATFANTSGTASDVGYGPFIDIILPANGADGLNNTDPPLDGINFLSATYLGNPVTSTVLTFLGSGPGNTCVAHPYAVAPTTGTALQVCGAPGDQLIVLQLPFGSFVPGQPPVTVDISASLSNLADVDTSLTIRARGGYQYGATALSDWCCAPFDATILSHPSTNSTTWPGSPVAPRLFTVTKAYSGPEDETATGPNFEREYTVTVDIADGQTLTNLDVSDVLPDNMQFVSFIGSVPASSAVTTPSISTPGGTLTRRFASVTGTTGTADATITFSFFIPRLDAGSAVILDAATGASVTSENNASATANWTPVDPRDAATPVVGICTPPCHTLNDRSIATQKAVNLVNDTAPAGISPGDTLEYSIDFQISDFFAFENVHLTDILSDGQHVDLTFAPTMTFSGNPATSDFAVTMDADNIDIACNYTGAAVGPACDSLDPAANNGLTTIVFDVSDEIFDQATTDRLIGGCIDPVTGSNPPNCSYNDGPTQGAIVFRAVIQQNFTDDFPSGDPSVDHGDVLDNTLTIEGDVLDSTTSAFTATGATATDDSAAGMVVGFGGLAKEVYAINSVVCVPCTTEITTDGINPDDTITFRLSYTQPASDFEETVITDYLPLPVFDATEVTALNNTICGVPAAGNACLGANDTFHTLTTPVPPAPTLATNGTANTVSFTYADYDNTSDVTSLIEVLFTVTVTGEPFADGLFLTNQAHVTEGTTNATPTAQDAIVLIRLNEPALFTTKSAVATDNPNGSITPAIAAPIVFNAPGTVGLTWSGGTISSTYLTPPIDTDLSLVDAGDLVRFAIIIRNEGHSDKGAFDIVVSDTFQPGYVIPGGPGLNLQIYRGDGLALTYTDLGGGIFGSGIQIDDPGAPGVGACQVYDATNGRNVIVITYDLQLDNAITLDAGIINTATLSNYAATSGGPDFTNPQDIIDTATVQPVSQPLKSIVTTSEAHTVETGTGTTASPRLVAIGEIVRYRIEQRVPEGTITNFRVHDALATGLTFIDDNTAQMVFVSDGGGGITSTTLGVGLDATGDETTVGTIIPTNVLPDTAVSETDSTSTANYAADDVDTYASGDDVFFKFGTLNNTDRDDNNEYVVIEFNAIAANIAGNTNRDNSAAARYGSSVTDGTSSNVVRVRVVQPSITMGKTIVSLPSPLDAGGVVQYRISFANASGANVSTAFDTHITDPLPAQLALNLGSITVTVAGGAAGVTDASAGNNLDITIASIPAGGSVIVDYTATIQDTVTPAEIVTNTSTVTWTSLPDSGTTPNGTGSTAGAAGGTTGERNGTGGVNDYTATSSRNFTTDSPSFTKQLTTTSASHTSGTDVVIGEEITYSILLAFPEGTTPADTVVDDLQAGLEVVTGTPQIITTAAASGGLLTQDFNGTIGTQSITTVAGDGGSVQFDFTNVVVTGDNDAADNVLLLRFRARVTNVAANQAGIVISNSATNQVGAAAPTTSNIVTATVVEPSITFGKVVVSVPTPLDAGGEIHYRITYSNGTGVTVSTAMDVNITDALAPELLLTSTNPPDLVITATGGVGAITNNSTTSNIDILIASVPAGESVTIDFRPIIQTSITPGQVISNTGNSTWTSLSGPDANERDGSGGVNDYAATSTVNTTADVLAPVKSIVSTSASHTSETGNGSAGNPRDLAIGEVIRYRLAVQIPEGTTTDLQLLDALPAGFTFLNDGDIRLSFIADTNMTEEADLAGADNDALPATFVLPAARIAVAGQDVTFTVGDLVNNDSDADQEYVVLDFNVVVNNDANNNNTDLDNNDFDLILSAVVVATSNTVETRIVEPVLNIIKNVTDPTPAVGQVLTFTLDLSHDAGSMADAFDVIIIDDLPTDLALDVGSISISTTGSVTTLPLANNSAGNHLEIVADSVGLGGTVQITFEATVVGAYLANYDNAGVVTWTSLPGTDAGERDGTQTPAFNDHRSANTISLNTHRALEKNLTATNVNTTTTPEVTIGEIVTYEIVLTIPAGSTDTAIVTDRLDSGLAFVSCSQMVASDAINVTSTTVDFTDVGNCNHGTTAGTNNPLISTSPASTGGDTITFDLGDIANASNAPQTITLTYDVVVLDIAANVQNAGVLLDNDVDWTWATGTLSATVVPALEIVEPDMDIEKRVNPAVAALGSTVTFTIDINHTLLSQTTAYDVILTDNMPTGLVLVLGSVASTETGGVTAGDTSASTPTSVIVSWDEFPVGGTARVTFQAVYNGPDAVFNTASVEWSTLEIDPVLGVSVQQSAYNPLSTERRYDPLDVTGVNNYRVSSTVRLSIPQRLPRTGFAPGRITALPEQPDNLAYMALGDLWLEIPDLAVKVDIVGVPYESQDWNLTWLAGNAGYLDGTAYPTHEGNSGITAHAYLADGTAGPFVNLDKLGYGDRVIVHLGGQQYIYEVREQRQMHPESVAAALKHEEYPWLTLITCKTYSETTDDYVYRTVVRAILVDVVPE